MEKFRLLRLVIVMGIMLMNLTWTVESLKVAQCVGLRATLKPNPGEWRGEEREANIFLPLLTSSRQIACLVIAGTKFDRKGKG